MHRISPALRPSRPAIMPTGTHGGLAILALVLAACSAPDNGQTEHVAQNPLLADAIRSPGMPPLSDFSAEHFEPAFDSALDEHRDAVRAIAGNPESPSFENTVAALEEAERPLDRLTRLLYGLHAVTATADTHRLAARLPGRLSEHFRQVYRDRRLHERLRDLARDHADRPAWQTRLTALSLRRLRHRGAGLSRADQRALDRLDERMQSLGGRFVDNLTAADSTPARHDSETGAGPGHSGLQSRPVDPRAVLAQHDDRGRRRQAWQARRLPDENGRANETLIRRINRLRHRHAQLLGYPSHAAYLFAGSEAGEPETVAGWLQSLARQLRPAIRAETRRLAARLVADGETAPAQPWDWRFYQANANPAGDTTRARFPLEAVRRGAFELAGALFGLSFRERPDIAVYHPDVRVFQVIDPEGDRPGILLMDDFSRPGKRSGAWTSHYTWSPEGSPVVATVTGFEPSGPGSPLLLTAEQTRTLFHEFGHAMQLLLSHARHPSLNASVLPADGIEFPALLFERFAVHPEMLARYADGDAIGNTLPDIPPDNFSATRSFPALDLSQSVIAAWLDLGWRRAAAENIVDIDAFEARMLASLGLPSISHPPYRSRHLARVFADTGRAGHYRHLLAELLAADVYARFEPGLFNPGLGAALKREIFQPGNARPILAGFEAFMGRSPCIEAFLSERLGNQ